MKILRDKEKKEKTPEEKELETYKKAKNLGLVGIGTGLASLGGSGIARAINRYKEKNPDANIDKDGNIKSYGRKLLIGGIIAGGSGLALHGISALKYRKLKKKLKEMEEKEDDNSKKKD